MLTVYDNAIDCSLQWDPPRGICNLRAVLLGHVADVCSLYFHLIYANPSFGRPPVSPYCLASFPRGVFGYPNIKVYLRKQEFHTSVLDQSSFFRPV